MARHHNETVPAFRRQREERRRREEWHRLIDDLKRRLADLNNWKCADAEMWFSRSALRDNRRNRTQSDYGRYGDDYWMFDHTLYFKMAGGYPACIVGQPYTPTIKEAEMFAVGAGLVLHVPPDPLASFHYPGATHFYAFTRPGVIVKFLPEQQDHKLLPQRGDYY